MKRLWVILFVVPLFAQDNPCNDEKYLKLKASAQQDILSLNDDEFNYYVSFRRKCLYYNEMEGQAQKDKIKEEEVKKAEEPIDLEKRKEEIRRMARKRIDEIEANKTPEQKMYEQQKKEETRRQRREVLQYILNAVNTPSTPSVLQTHLCQFDNSKLYTNGETKYGQNTTKFRLWICPSDNSHQFWLPD